MARGGGGFREQGLDFLFGLGHGADCSELAWDVDRIGRCVARG
jgi:hypothetical protein